jgi:uncharacterized zinc-type alcohol dehydrogenase-like protein
MLAAPALSVDHRPSILLAVHRCHARRVSAALRGGVKETQEMLDFCAAKKVLADIELIPAKMINEAYERTIKGQVKYRFVIDAKTF